ncbi:MAG: redox-regulated ATPase YchF [Ignavibacteriae bacterium]|nr:redox-regulated ATPase YchF [Ignavibacteriota bacterium]
MGIKCGIVGLPNVGKSTLFNAITAAGAAAENYPFCTIDPNLGIVTVPDKRLHRIAEIYKPAKITPTTIEFVDIAGLVRGASKGEGLGNQFLSHIREVDAICHVVRCFEDENVVHVDGNINPIRDIEIVETELILKDLETIERKQAEAEKKARSADKKIKAEAEYYTRIREHLLSGRLAIYEHPETPDEQLWLRDSHLLTAKPVMYICNVDEQHIAGESVFVQQVREHAKKEGAKVVIACTKIEAEIAAMPFEERESFLHELGIQHSGLEQVIHEGYSLLNLITFFTSGDKEARAWTIRKGSYAPQAAGEIHSDFERGFIRAEVIKYKDLDSLGSVHAVKEKGMLHVEGHEYVVEDGDVMFFRFNV